MTRVIENAEGEPWFAVEVQGPESPLRGNSNVLRTTAESIADVGSVIAKSCTDIMSAMKDEFSSALPDEVELNFGVALSGETGIPLISKASGEATFSVRICWKPSGN